MKKGSGRRQVELESDGRWHKRTQAEIEAIDGGRSEHVKSSEKEEQ